MQAAPGVGIDLIEIERVERALERRPRLRERVFTPGEIEASARRRRPARHLAARFAAKEAALKCLGIGGLRLHEIEVLGGGDEPPRLRLHGGAAEVAEREGIELSVSISHSRELATAVVVASGDRRTSSDH
jgi:holo-[acyl-carrier protein] synthase